MDGTARTEIVLDGLQHECGDFEPTGTVDAAPRSPRDKRILPNAPRQWYSAVAAVVWLALAASSAPIQAQDWPYARHDLQRTGRQSLAGDIAVPAVTHGFIVGGGLGGDAWLVADVNLDERPDVVVLRGGRAVARGFDGTLIWASAPHGLDWLLAASDLDEDGRIEVFGGSLLRGLFALDGATGELLWHPDWSPERRLGDVFPIDVSGDGHPELYVADRGCSMGGSGTGRIYSFEGGFAATGDPTRLDVTEHGYWCGIDQAAGDLDGNGSSELVTLSNDRVVTYDPATGAPLLTSEPLGAFPYGNAQTVVVDLDGDGRDEVVVASNRPGTVPTAKRLLLLEVEEGQLQLRWTLELDATDGNHRFTSDLVADLTPEEGLEIVTSFYDPGQEQWRTILLSGRADTPTPRVEWLDQVVAGHLDLDGDGLDELVTFDVTGRHVGPPALLRAYRLSGTGPTEVEELWQLAQASLPREASPWLIGDHLVSSPGSDAVLVGLRDTDADGRPEAVLSLSAAGSILAEHTVDGTSVAGVRFLSEEALLVSRADGRVEVLNAALTTTNDSRPADGLPDLETPTHLAHGLVARQVSEATLLAMADSTDAPVVFRFQPGQSDVELLWTRNDLVPGSIPGTAGPLEWLDPEAGTLAFRAQALDGQQALVLVDESDGSELSRFPVPGGALTPVNDVVPVRDDGSIERLLQSYYDPQTAAITHLFLDPDTGESTTLPLSRTLVWSWERPPSLWHLNDDGVEDILMTQGQRMRAADGLTGTLIADVFDPLGSGLLTVGDLDGDGQAEVLHHGGFVARGLNLDLEEEWAEETGRQRPGALAPLNEGGLSVGIPRETAPELVLIDGRDGSPLGRVELAEGATYADPDALAEAGVTGGTLSPALSVDDLTGLGHASFVVGSTDGWLYALSAEDGWLDWSINLRAAVGEPIAADFDGDGKSEIAVPVGDGHIYVIDRASIGAPPFVFDTDGTFVATNEDEDVDVLFEATRAGANWGAVEGATGYEAQLIRDDDIAIVSWRDVGGERRIVFDGLSLGTEHGYSVLVRAYDRDGPERVSVESSSDGFTVEDGEDPVVAISADPVDIFPEGGPGIAFTVITATLRDDVRLARYAIRIEDDEGDPVLTLAGAEIGGTERRETASWSGRDAVDGPVAGGTYWAVAEVTDASGRRATASTEVRVCTPDSAVWDKCTEADEEPVEPPPEANDEPDVGESETQTPLHPVPVAEQASIDVTGESELAGDEGPDLASGPLPEGCGCRISAEPPASHALFWIAVLALLATRCRRSRLDN